MTGVGSARWCWGTWLVVTAAGWWLAFVVVHLWLSGRVWWWTVPELMPPVAFLAIPATLLAVAPLARPARRRIVVLILVSAALGWHLTGINPAALWHRTEPVPPGAVTVFSWNTWYWDQLIAPTPPGDPPPVDTDEFYRYLRAQHADVYLLQEYLYLSEDLEPIRLTELPRLRREFPGYQVVAVGELVTLSRFPVVYTRGLDLRPYLTRPVAGLPPPGSQLPAYFTVKTLRTDLRMAGRTLSVYNAHIYVPAVGPPVRRPDRPVEDGRVRHDLRQANYRALAADIAGNPHPIVLAGDLNTTPAMGMLRTLPDRLADATPATGSPYPTSWARYGLPPLWRLDWVFTTTHVNVHRYRMVPSHGLSDHSGQHVTLSVPGCPEGSACR